MGLEKYSVDGEKIREISGSRATNSYCTMIAALMPSTSLRLATPLAQQTAELRSAVRGLVAAMLRAGADSADVEDCTNEALRRALEHQARLRPGEPLRPWLLGIARHVALDMLRSRRRKSEMLWRETETTRARGAAPIEFVVDPAPNPFEVFESAQQRERLQAALAALPEGVGSALLLFHVEGKSYQQIAAELGVPLGTVATWVSRGRKALAEKLNIGDPSP